MKVIRQASATLVLSLVALGVWPCVLEAQVSAASQAHDLTQRLMSPYCPGLTLADCPSMGARSIREEIRTRLDAGEPATQIKTDLVRRFGSQVSGEPEAAGFGWFAWSLPPLMGAATLVLVITRIRSSSVNGPSGLPDVEDPAIAARLTHELELLD